jgi:hypothetical protein
MVLISKKEAIIYAIILFIGLASLIAYSILPRSVSPIEAETYFAINLPDDITDFHSRYLTWLDKSMSLKFRIPASSFDDFEQELVGLCFTDGLVEQHNPFPIDFDWWTPSVAEVYMGGQCHNEDYRYFEALVDMTNPNEYIIYLSGS